MNKIMVNDATGCWEWCGYIRKDGYAQTTRMSETDYVHRHAYRDAHGAIPAGMVIDHTCGVRHCCNPSHLEAVPQSVNVQRGRLPSLTAERNRARSAAQTHCRHGHEFTPENTYVNGGRRHCRACHRRRVFESKRRR